LPEGHEDHSFDTQKFRPGIAPRQVASRRVVESHQAAEGEEDAAVGDDGDV